MSIQTITSGRETACINRVITGFSEFETVETGILSAISDSEGPIRDMCCHILKAGGKRVRPFLLISTGKLFRRDRTEDLVKAAVASELIHMASLVHDDIIDNSSRRRSKPSVNHIWGNTYAVLCGDYLFAKAFGILSERSIAPCMGYMVEAIHMMCQGEIQQASELYDTSMDIKRYYDRIAKKTAVFLADCCRSGAAIAGASAMQIEIAAQYGLNLGYAFQITDDILDICGDSAVMGKPSGEDLAQGNLTLPVILLINSRDYGDVISQIIKRRDFTKNNMDMIRSALQESGIMERIYQMAAIHIRLAKKALNCLPPSEDGNILYRTADLLGTRSN